MGQAVIIQELGTLCCYVTQVKVGSSMLLVAHTCYLPAYEAGLRIELPMGLA